MGFRNELCLLSLLATVAGVFGGDYCYDLDDGVRRYCTYGCCGYLDGDCCDANVALIVGLTVLGILVVSTIIAVVCCCMRRRAAHGTVIQTNPASGMVVTTAQQGVIAPGQPMPYAPQGYQAYPMGQQPPQPYPMGQQPPQPYTTGQAAPPATAMGPPAYPAGVATAPPPYTEQSGGQVNTGFDYKQLN